MISMLSKKGAKCEGESWWGAMMMPSQTFLVKSTASLLLKIPKLIKSLFHLLIKEHHPRSCTIQERIRLMQQLLQIRSSIVLPMTGEKERETWVLQRKKSLNPSQLLTLKVKMVKSQLIRTRRSRESNRLPSDKSRERTTRKTHHQEETKMAMEMPALWSSQPKAPTPQLFHLSSETLTLSSTFIGA